jgi:formate dehydrogenase subunit gamma
MPASREPWDAARAAALIAEFARTEGATLPALHALQGACGWLPDEAVPLVAHALNLSRAEVHGVLTFYHDFRREPPGRVSLKLCRAEACQSVGADALASRIQRRLGTAWHGTTADGAVTLEPAFCLGLCAVGPAALVDDTPIGHADEGRIAASIARAMDAAP